jgi:hypothetical protein
MLSGEILSARQTGTGTGPGIGLDEVSHMAVVEKSIPPVSPGKEMFLPREIDETIAKRAVGVHTDVHVSEKRSSYHCIADETS